MPRRVLFDKIALNIPDGFPLVADRWIAIASRKAPFRSIVISDCSHPHAGSGYVETRMTGGQQDVILTPVEYAKKFFPDQGIRETLRRVKPGNPIFNAPDAYAWYIHLPEFSGQHLLLEFGGVYSLFESDIPLWLNVLSSLSLATDDERRRNASLTDYEIALKKFAAWGRRNPEWRSDAKKRSLTIDYPDNKPSPYTRQIINEFRKREAVIADAVSEKMFAAFVADDYPFFEGSNGILGEFGIRVGKSKDITDHMFLNGISVPAFCTEGMWQLYLSFSTTWNVHGLAVLIVGLLSGSESSEIVVKLDNDH